jgi:hypothetical protein
MEKLDTFPTSVPILSRRKVIMKERSKIRSKPKLIIKRSSTRKIKTFFTQEDNSSSKENEEDEPELLFIGIKNQNDNHSEDEEEVNFEE